MRRLTLMALGFGGGLAVAALVAAALWWDMAVKIGQGLYDHRPYVQRALAPRSGGGPLVVWFGDSTIALASYPQLLAQQWRERGEERAVRIVALPGFDCFDYYFGMGPALELRPDLVVLVAHLRMFGKGDGSTRTLGDLSALIPARELPRAFALPLYDRGITVPRLLLSRTLLFRPVERGMYFLEGLRSSFDHAAFREVLGPRAQRWDVTTGMRAVGKMAPNVLASYDVAVSPRLPIVRMIAATVDMAVRHGVPVLVVGSPIPAAALRAAGRYDDALYAQRFEVLREVVQQAGGTFLDLHDALSAEEFKDTGGHYNERGVRRLGTLVEPVILKTLAGATLHEPIVRAASQNAAGSPR
jgi:hypothetical protein